MLHLGEFELAPPEGSAYACSVSPDHGHAFLGTEHSLGNQEHVTDS